MSQATAYLDQSFDTPDARQVRRRAILACAVDNFVELFALPILGAVISAATLFAMKDPTNAPLE
jgi:hypothetical protein